jgi:hypothetical protein
VVPEFLYSELYDAKGRAIGIHGQGHLRRKFIQKGLREKLLCDDCEQFLNERYEKKFKEYWFDKNPLPEVIPADGILLRNIDYNSFKLFHLSILFRCGVARHPTYSDVNLGRHEDILRKMICDVDAGGSGRYPIFAHAVIRRNNVVESRLISRPIKTRFDGHIMYGIMFGGCMWYYTVSKHGSKMMADIGLQGNGTMHLVPERWENMAIVQQVGRVLRGEAL